MQKEGGHLTNKVYYATVTVKIPLTSNKARTAHFLKKTMDMPTRSKNVREMRDSDVDLAYIKQVLGKVSEFEIETLRIS